MAGALLGQLFNLGITALITLLVLSHYRHARFDPPQIYSTFWPRFWAGSVDSCVLWPIGFLTSVLLNSTITPIEASLVVVTGDLAGLLYVVLMHGRYGQTVGKMVCKVRVIDNRTNRKISFGQAWLREGFPTVLSIGLLVYEISALLSDRVSPNALVRGEGLPTGIMFWLLTSVPLLWFLAEIATMLTNARRRALHDLIAGTVVIRTNIRDDIF